MKQLSLKDKVALVTGGARGIGRAIVEAFAEQGARIIVADIDEEGAAGLALQIGQQSFSVQLDVSEIGTVEGSVREAAERAGRIDILVSNAAIYLRHGSASRRHAAKLRTVVSGQCGGGSFLSCKPSRG